MSLPPPSARDARTAHEYGARRDLMNALRQGPLAFPALHGRRHPNGGGERSTLQRLHALHAANLLEVSRPDPFGPALWALTPRGRAVLEAADRLEKESIQKELKA